MGDTSIEWTQKVWNPVRGCSRVSPGCQHCYAETIAARFTGKGQPFEGFAKRTAAGGRWTGTMALLPEKLGEPLSWRRSALVFVSSMSDLFHEGLKNEEIAAVFGVMAACPQHTFQILTKRAERLPEWFRWLGAEAPVEALGRIAACVTRRDLCDLSDGRPWPLPNVWLGASVEDQQRADERIPHLVRAPAAVRFLSCEPLLGPVDLERWIGYGSETMGLLEDPPIDGRLSWVICGGESGPGARPMDVAWMRSLKEQCAAAGVPYFGKQMGPMYVSGGIAVDLRDRKGGDPAEWPEDLRVRQMPGVPHA